MDLKSHMQQLEKALGESCRDIAELMCTQPQSQGEASQSFKHLETRQIRTDCPISVRQMTKAGFSGDNDGMMVDFKCIYRGSLHWNCFPRKNLRFQKTTYWTQYTAAWSNKGGPKRIHLQGPGTLRTARKGTLCTRSRGQSLSPCSQTKNSESPQQGCGGNMGRNECFGEEVLQQNWVQDPTKQIPTLFLAWSEPN